MHLTPEITFAGRQSRGRRENQEDAYGFCPLGDGEGGGLLLALADGMGGHQRGEVASRLAVAGFVRNFDPRAADARRALVNAVLAANASIGAENRRVGGATDEMGTTFIGLFLQGNALRWVSVGDSPLYLYRGRDVHRLNAEHSNRGEPRADGQLFGSAMLTSALTGGAISLIDAPADAFLLQPGDILIGASDGINSITHHRLTAQMELYSAQSAGLLAETLIDTVDAERRSAQDNLTVTVVKYVGGDA